MRFSHQATQPRGMARAVLVTATQLSPHPLQDGKHPCTERNWQTMHPHKAVPTGGQEPRKWSLGLGLQGRTRLTAFPKFSFLPPSEHKENNAFAFPKISLGRKWWVRRMRSPPTWPVKAQKHAGLETLPARSSGETDAGGNKRAPRHLQTAQKVTLLRAP